MRLLNYIIEFILFSNLLVFIFIYFPATSKGDSLSQYQSIAFICLTSNILIYILLVKFRKHLKQ